MGEISEWVLNKRLFPDVEILRDLADWQHVKWINYYSTWSELASDVTEIGVVEAALITKHIKETYAYASVPNYSTILK